MNRQLEIRTGTSEQEKTDVEQKWAKRPRKAGMGIGTPMQVGHGRVGPDERELGASADFAAKLDRPRAIWLMLPAAIVDPNVDKSLPHLEADDVVIDCGNSYRDDITRAHQLGERKIHYGDVGTSGGVWGLERGCCPMIGGEDEVVARLDPIFKTIASRDRGAFTGKVLSAMRGEFGGHAEKR